ncbi:MAG: GTPase [Candidatus Electrothrix sp. MAN1_4]|nr:GTPase [Candidatus Electrothrix sp. MAN1_4]
MKLIFVYNADSGKIHTMMDIGHKLLSPQTYSCNLCQMTHGLLKEKEKWKKFRETSGYELEFLHKDEFEKKYQMQTCYPVILQEQEDRVLQEVVGQVELNNLQDVEELIRRLHKL